MQYALQNCGPLRMNESRARVLCVDDDPTVLAGLRSFLSPDYAVSTATDAIAAVHLIETSEPFAVVVTDLQMPNMDGIELLRWVATHSTDTCGILLTGHANVSAVIDAVNAGHAFRVLTKPCLPEELQVSVGAAIDHYEMQCMQRLLLQQATVDDVLTGLPDRRRFALDVSRLRQSEPGTPLALVVVAVDDLELVRRTLGFAAADALFVEAVRRLQSFIRDPKFLLRHAELFRIEDRLALLWCESTLAAALPVAEHLIKAMEADVFVAGHKLRLSSHVGIAGINVVPVTDAEADDPLMALRNAEAACLESLAVGGSRIGHFSVSAHAREQRQLRLLQRIRHPEFISHLSCVYQPQWHLSRNRLIGLEALVRWEDPELGVIAPNEFIPLTEEHPETAERLGDWVMLAACRQRQAWRDLIPDEVRIGVNISATQLRTGDLHERVFDCLRRTGLPHEMLEVEITESAAIADFTKSDAQLQALRRHGINVAIDDFGVGFSSLNYLAQLPATSLKVDRAFIAAVEEGSRHVDLLQGICGLGHAMHMNVVAEGAESFSVVALLERLGCDVVQGYVIARPLTAAAFLEWYGGERLEIAEALGGGDVVRIATRASG
jgi:EAL domain-containing protein (putative c-di-GMP-specific phosphodiesterase class I)/CheY-like chemotaxis protein